MILREDVPHHVDFHKYISQVFYLHFLNVINTFHEAFHWKITHWEWKLTFCWVCLFLLEHLFWTIPHKQAHYSKYIFLFHQEDHSNMFLQKYHHFRTIIFLTHSSWNPQNSPCKLNGYFWHRFRTHLPSHSSINQSKFLLYPWKTTVQYHVWTRISILRHTLRHWASCICHFHLFCCSWTRLCK